jgi:hypothetical protein
MHAFLFDLLRGNGKNGPLWGEEGERGKEGRRGEKMGGL